MPVAQMNSVLGKKISPLFPFHLSNAHLHRRAPRDTRVNPPPPCLLYYQISIWRDPFALLLPVCCRWEDTWIPGQRGKAKTSSLPTPLPHNWLMKRSSRRKKTENRVKQRRWGERRVKGAVLGREMCLSCPTWWQCLPEVWRRKIKIGTSFHVGVQCLMLVFQNYV